MQSSTAQHRHQLEDHEQQRRVFQQQQSWAKGRSSDYEILEEPRKITTEVTIVKHQLEGDTSGVIISTIYHRQAGVKQPAKISIVAVPGLGRNIVYDQRSITHQLFTHGSVIAFYVNFDYQFFIVAS